jgi:hypothetical protein
MNLTGYPKYSTASKQEKKMTEDSKVADGQVVLMDYALTVDGKVIDQSEKDDPLEFIRKM